MEAAGAVAGTFRDFGGPVGIEVILKTPREIQPWDAINYLGGIADVLQAKPEHARLSHLGELREVALYRNDRQIREVRYHHEVTEDMGYGVRLWTLGPDTPPITPPVPLKQIATPKPQHAPRRAITTTTGSDRGICLAFLNSIRGGSLDDPLSGYDAAVRWLHSHGSLTDSGAETLMGLASHNDSEANAVLLRLITLRETVTGLVNASIESRSPLDSNAETFRSLFVTMLPHRRMRSRNGSIVYELEGNVTLERPLWLLLCAAEGLLLGRHSARLRACADPRCGRFFLDTSKNRSRRWCSMARCGNRAKVRRHYERRRVGRRSAEPV